MALLKFEDFRKQLNESEANPHAAATRPAVGGGANDSEKRVSVRIRYAKAGYDQKVINERLKNVGGIEVSKSNIESGETIELHVDFPTQAKFEEFRGMHEANLVNENKVEFELILESAIADELQELAKEMVGDGKKPNVYFVGRVGNVEMVTTDGKAAYSHWQSITTSGVETMMEDRLTGTVCFQLKDDENGGKIQRIDDYRSH